MYLLLYDNITGDIIGATSTSDEIKQTTKSSTANYPEEKKTRTSGIYVNNIPIPMINYKVIDERIVERPSVEITELKQYGKILTDEERLLNKLKPSIEEIRKAEQTIEILTLIQEVM